MSIIKNVILRSHYSWLGAINFTEINALGVDSGRIGIGSGLTLMISGSSGYLGSAPEGSWRGRVGLSWLGAGWLDTLQIRATKQMTKIKKLSHTSKGILINNIQNCLMDKLYLMEFRSGLDDLRILMTFDQNSSRKRQSCLPFDPKMAFSQLIAL